MHHEVRAFTSRPTLKGIVVNSFRRIISLGAGVLLVAASNAACGGESQSGGSDSADTIVIGVAPGADTTGPWIAEEQGFFADEGLSVEVEVIGGGAALVPALQSDSMQLGSSNLVSNLQALEQGIDLRCVAGAFKGSKSTQFVGSLESSPIETGADLEGKTVGINTIGNINQLIVDKWVEDNGGDPRKVQYVAVGFPDQAAALKAGHIDAAITVDPFTTGMVQDGYPVIDDYPVGVIAPKPTFSCWTATGDWVEENPEAVDAFRRAMKKVDEYVAANPDVVREAAVQYLNVPETAAAAMNMPAISTEMSEQDVQDWLDAAMQYGILKEAVDASSLNGGYSD